MQITTYIHFDNNCEEAINFYKKAVGAEVKALMHFKDGPPPDPNNPASANMPPGDAVMHSEVQFGDTFIFMSDCGARMQGVSLIYSCKDTAEAERIFNGMAEGGKVQQSLTKTFFSPAYGKLKDQFGVDWIVLVPQERPRR